MKGWDGVARHQFLVLTSVTGTPTLIAAPGVGFQIVVYEFHGGCTGVFVLESPAGTSVFRMVPTTQRPFSMGDARGLFRCPDNALLRANTANTLDGGLTFEIRPTEL